MEQTIKWFSADELPKKGGHYLIAGRMVVNNHIKNVVVSCAIQSYSLPRTVEEQNGFWNETIKKDMTIEYWAEFPKSPLVSTSDNDLDACLKRTSI